MITVINRKTGKKNVAKCKQLVNLGEGYTRVHIVLFIKHFFKIKLKK